MGIPNNNNWAKLSWFGVPTNPQQRSCNFQTSFQLFEYFLSCQPDDACCFCCSYRQCNIAQCHVTYFCAALVELHFCLATTPLLVTSSCVYTTTINHLPKLEVFRHWIPSFVETIGKKPNLLTSPSQPTSGGCFGHGQFFNC